MRPTQPDGAPRRARTLRRGAAAAAAGLALAAGAACAGAPAAPPGAAPAPAAELRVLVLNMHAGTDAAGRDNLDRVAALVRETAADVVLLQEVDSGVARSGRVDQPAELARRTGLHARFGNALAYQGGGYGIATLSRWPVDSARLVRLPVDPPQERAGGSREPRGVLHLAIAAPWGTLHVLNTHLDPSADDRWRVQEGDSLLGVVRAIGAHGRALLVGGDLNATPDSRAQQRLRAGGLRDLWPGCGAGDGHTFPVAAPTRRIDYLYAARGAACTTAAVLASDASDHRGVLYTLRLDDRRPLPPREDPR